MSYYFVIDEILNILNMSPLSSECNLTHQYYSKKLLTYIQQRRLRDLWHEFISCPKEQQLLEQAATIVAQWYQPDKFIFYLDVEILLDNIAQQVLENLKNIHCNHPIFSISAEQFSFWKYNNIKDNQWSRKDEKQILDVLRIVLFDQLNFSSSPGPYPFNILGPKAEHILIDSVLENKAGNVISLAIVFQSVARRLGVRCDLVCFPTHFFLSWKPKFDKKNYGDDEYYYIDILHGGFIRSKNECPRTRGRRCPIESFNEHHEITSIEVVLRMINSLQLVNPPYQHHETRALQVRRALMELRYMVEPNNIDAIDNLCRHYLHYHINISGLVAELHKLLNSYSDKTSVEATRIIEMLQAFESYIKAKQTTKDHTVPKERSKKIKYAVGMIVRCCEMEHINHKGVIIWWDAKYNSEVKIAHEYRIFCGTHLPYCSFSDTSRTSSDDLNQPFYIILSENGNTYYAAQDSLVDEHSLSASAWLENKEIGRYFSKFAGSHYIPNEVLAKHFPYDTAFLNMRCPPTVVSTETVS
ncbi:hypothetical protein PUN28_015982 [Cardiocondyla obscurior]